VICIPIMDSHMNRSGEAKAKSTGLADALSEMQFLQTFLLWNDVRPQVANFVVTILAKREISKHFF
jgi:hypothetical protein